MTETAESPKYTTVTTDDNNNSPRQVRPRVQNKPFNIP